MADSASDRSSGECATDVHWMKLPSEIWLEIFSYLSPVTILNEVAFVCRKFNSLSFHLSLWNKLDLTNWESFIENLSPVIDLLSENLRSLSFCQINGNFVFGSDKRWLFYKFSNIVRLELPECEYVTAQILEEIRKNCKKIERLNLSECRNVDDQAMKVVSKFEHLTKLDITQCHQVTDDGVNFIADMPCQILHFLSFDVQQFSDRGIVNLVTKQTKIEFLILSGDNITDYSVIDACHCLVNLKKFHIYDCRNLTDRSIHALCGKVRLECLCLQRATKVSTQAFNHLFQEKPRLNLKDLCIGDTDAVVDDTVYAISSGSKFVVILSSSFTITCFSRKYFARYPHLERIELNFCCKVTDKSIDELIKSCRKLEVVSLQGLTSLKGDWLAEIERYLPKLRSLTMCFCCGISEEKVKHLFLRKPDLELLWNRMPINELKHEDIDRVLRNITLEDFE
ncbi:F-box and leucine-rich repeat protein 13-like [Clavelina lepadiformis]|uniref:F-box and leucine-rich repeat protein 13-like n=1 Tax=Clavelina lepadiformis TaxID=159417 RepID=UPI0040430B99